MEIKRVLYVEDSVSKYMDLVSELNRLGVEEIEWVSSAKKAIDALENAEIPFDLFLFDMHFDFFGEDDQKAGVKLMQLVREKGYETPVIFCSSENWRIPGAFGNIYYHPDRYWEKEARELLSELRAM